MWEGENVLWISSNTLTGRWVFIKNIISESPHNTFQWAYINQKPKKTFCSYSYLHFVPMNFKHDWVMEPNFQIDNKKIAIKKNIFFKNTFQRRWASQCQNNVITLSYVKFPIQEKIMFSNKISKSKFLRNIFMLKLLSSDSLIFSRHNSFPNEILWNIASIIKKKKKKGGGERNAYRPWEYI